MTVRFPMRGAIRALAAALLVAGCSSTSEPAPVDPPQEFVSLKRAWLPGERDSTIARIVRDAGFGPFSAFAAQVYADLDSVWVIAANPDFSVRAGDGTLLMLAPRWGLSWNIMGVRWININTNPIPNDSTIWTGIFWSNPSEAGWKGFILRAGASATFGPAQVNTAAFDASFGKTGAGGGEVRSADSTEWTSTGPVIPARNTIEISNVVFGAPATIGSGPFTGGTLATGTMQGRSKRVEMTRVLNSGPSGPASFEVDYDFRGGIQGAEIKCVFPSPCTTNVPGILAALR